LNKTDETFTTEVITAYLSKYLETLFLWSEPAILHEEMED